MSTRSNTLVIETDDGKDQILVNMYRQMDGYPSGHGKELAEFLAKVKMVNGIGLTTPSGTIIANGTGCLAAQIVAHFKDGAGGIYLSTPTRSACDNDYTYIVRADTFKPGPIQVEIRDYNQRRIFVGDVKAFLEFCNQPE